MYPKLLPLWSPYTTNCHIDLSSRPVRNFATWLNLLPSLSKPSATPCNSNPGRLPNLIPPASPWSDKQIVASCVGFDLKPTYSNKTKFVPRVSHVDESWKSPNLPARSTVIGLVPEQHDSLPAMSNSRVHALKTVWEFEIDKKR